MNQLEPSNQQKIIGLDCHMLELVKLYKSNIYPNKLLILDFAAPVAAAIP